MAIDPVRARRRRFALFVKLGKRAGYLLWLAAMVLVVVALATDLHRTVLTAAAACLVVGAVLLAPAIIVGYAVNAAEREDRALGH
jgi:hypothetical protein